MLTSKYNLLEQLVDSLPGKIVVKDLSGKFLFQNQYSYQNHLTKDVSLSSLSPSPCGTTATTHHQQHQQRQQVLEFPLVNQFNEIIGACSLTLDAHDNHNNNGTSSSCCVCCCCCCHGAPTCNKTDKDNAAKPNNEPNHNEETKEGNELKQNQTHGLEQSLSLSSSSSLSKGHGKAKTKQPLPLLPLPKQGKQQHQQQLQHEELDESEQQHDDKQRYQKVMENIQVGAALYEMILDDDKEQQQQQQPVVVDCFVKAVNPAFKQLFGLHQEKDVADIIGKRASQIELLGRRKPTPQQQQPSSSLSSQDDKDDSSFDWIMQQFGNVALSGTTVSFQQYSEKVDKWFSLTAYRPSQKKGECCVLFLDITENVRAKEALVESEERHRNLFESMVQGVVYQEVSGSIIAANPAAQRILGLTMDQMMGRTSVDPRWKATHEDGSDFPGETHPAMVALQTGKSVKNVTMGVFHPQDEELHWIKIDAVPRFKKGETTPFQVYTTFTDITEDKKKEREIVRAKERAEVADRLKSAFLANMSHEIRTPVHGIMGHIDLILSNGLDVKHREENLESLNIAKLSGDLLLTIIQDVLDLSKIEAGQLEVKNDDSFSIREIVKSTKYLAHGFMTQKKKNLQFESHVDPRLQDSITGDPFRLRQVINNLLSNAIKFTSEGAVGINFNAVPESNMFEIRVSDTGKGIPESHLESIFEPFRQVDIGDTRQFGGTGLGLTISRKLARMMKGDLRVKSSTNEPNKGSCFILTLPYNPCHTRREKQPETTSPTDSSPNQKQNTHGRKTILVAEDDNISRKLIKRMIARCGEYSTILAANGVQAIRLFEAHRESIGLILMDIQMPEMDGLTATKLIRQKEAASVGRESNTVTSNVPIIAVSASAMKGDQERGLKIGMTDYLTKPVEMKLLSATLVKYLGQFKSHKLDA